MTEAESNNIRDWNFAPLRRAETLSDRTTELLRERILAGDFGLGERLVEARIARQLQISRGPVREALRQLRAEGLVREEPRRGSFVADLTIDDIREIYDLRGDRGASRPRHHHQSRCRCRARRVARHLGPT